MPCSGVAQLADDAERERPRHAEVPRVDVDLDQLLAGGVAPVLVVGDVEVPQPRAGDEDHVGLGAGEVAGGSEPEEVVGVIARHGRATGHRRDHGAAEELDQLDHGVVRVAAVDAAAGDDQRRAAACEQRGGLGELLVARARAVRAVARRGANRGAVRPRRSRTETGPAGRCAPAPGGRSTSRGTRAGRPRGCAGVRGSVRPISRPGGTGRPDPGPGTSRATRDRRAQGDAGR